MEELSSNTEYLNPLPNHMTSPHFPYRPTPTWPICCLVFCLPPGLPSGVYFRRHLPSPWSAYCPFPMCPPSFFPPWRKCCWVAVLPPPLVPLPPSPPPPDPSAPHGYGYCVLLMSPFAPTCPPSPSLRYRPPPTHTCLRCLHWHNLVSIIVYPATPPCLFPLLLLPFSLLPALPSPPSAL